MTPLGHYRKQLRIWLHQYGSEVPDELFKLAQFAWLELFTMKQAVFSESATLQNMMLINFQRFAAAKEKWENR